MVAMTIKKGPITVGDIVKTLSNMVTVSECDVFGYLSLEGDIIIMVAAITQNPTSLQVCILENLFPMSVFRSLLLAAMAVIAFDTYR